MKRIYSILLMLLAGVLFSCSDSDLDEKPMDKFSPENLLTSKAGFETIVNSLYTFTRDGLFISSNDDAMNTGTDVACSGVKDGRFFNDYSLILPEHATPKFYWNWAYEKMLKCANMIISRAEAENIDWTEDEKNEILAYARFFRGYTYNVLVNLFGGVPIVDKEEETPRFDYTRASREEVLKFIQSDLEFAAQYLPIVTESSVDGKVYRAAAYHLLSEVYISLGLETGDDSYFDKSISAASTVIDGECGDYQLVRARFGNKSRAGDYYSDLFWTNQQNRSSGNKEGIWVLQYEYLTPGGEEANNTQLRLWGPKIEDVTFPDGKKILVCDTIGRMQGIVRPLNHVNYEIWQDDPEDMRYSKYNFKKDFYMNNEESEYFGVKVVLTKQEDGKFYITLPDGTVTKSAVDTFRVFFPYFRKIEGEMPWGAKAGRTPNDKYMMRLSETYLLRAEAYFHKGDLENAAKDINVIRERAKAKPVDPQNVTLDYILDERMRELVVEEPRRRTLVRLNKLYERTMKYNFRVQSSMQPYHELWPIPQSAIDANTGAVIEQNPGYPGAD